MEFYDSVKLASMGGNFTTAELHWRLSRFLFCLVLVVATNPDIQYQRLRQRNTDLTEDDCRNRIQSQYPVERKVAGADIVIWNNGSVEELENQVRQVKATVKRRLYGGMPMYALVFVVGLVRLLAGKIYQ